MSDCCTARQSVEHDDLNVLCLGARVIGPELARELVHAFAAVTFSRAERHVRRLAEIGHDNVDVLGRPRRPRATSEEIEA